MIVLGADTHKRSHTIAAVSVTSGELLGGQTVQSGAKGAAALLRWARGLGDARVWALEDCRHVSGSLERFVIQRGERVLRVHSTLMSAARRRARGRGKSDSIDALAVARAAVREGLDRLPAAHLDGPELDFRLLVDHRERLVRQRVAINNTLQWHLHDLWPEIRFPGSALFHGKLGSADSSPARPRRANDARPNRPRRAAPHPRTDPDDHGPGRPDRPASWPSPGSGLAMTVAPADVSSLTGHLHAARASVASRRAPRTAGYDRAQLGLCERPRLWVSDRNGTHGMSGKQG